MEKPSLDRTLRRLALGSPSASVSKGGSRTLGRPKGSLGNIGHEKKQLQLDDSIKLEKRYNRSTQMVNTPSCSRQMNQIKSKGYQDMLSRSEAKFSIFKGKPSDIYGIDKKKPKQRDSYLTQSVYSISNTPKAKLCPKAALNKDSPTRPAASDRTPSMLNKTAVREIIIDINSYLSQVPVSARDLPVYEQLQEFMLQNNPQVQQPKDNRDKNVAETEENMPTTRPISVEDNKTSAFKNIADKKKIITSTTSVKSSSRKFSSRGPLQFGNSPKIKFDIPKNLHKKQKANEPKLELKAVSGTSSPTKMKLSRLVSHDGFSKRKDVSPSIQRRVSVVKESPLIPFSSNTTKSVFFALNSDKSKTQIKKNSVREKLLKRPHQRAVSGPDTIELLASTIKKSDNTKTMNFSQETSLANVYKNALLLPGGSLMTCDHNVEGLEHSFYKLLTEWLPSDPKLSFSEWENLWSTFKIGFLADLLCQIGESTYQSEILRKYTLVFDLDETLVHYRINRPVTDSQTLSLANNPFSTSASTKQTVKVV